MVITPCEFERATIDVQLAFDDRQQDLGPRVPPAARPWPYAPPSYATPSAFAETDVTVGSGEWALPGTLTMPTGAGPFPAIVLVHGSGPNDRDETVGANKPFKDLAAGLASRGVAVLRYDKRTKVYGAKMAASPTLHRERGSDRRRGRGAGAAAHRAAHRSRARVRARPQSRRHADSAHRSPPIRSSPALIVMAGAARPIEEAIVEQTKYLAAADGTVTPEEQARIDETTKMAQAIAAVTPADAAAGRRVLNAPAAYWLDLRGYDAPSAAKDVKVPMLVLQGDRDYQVTMAEFARWKAGARRPPRRHVPLLIRA